MFGLQLFSVAKCLTDGERFGAGSAPGRRAREDPGDALEEERRVPTRDWKPAPLPGPDPHQKRHREVHHAETISHA